MYTPETVEILEQRIGFGKSQELGFPLEIADAVAFGDSERFFRSFHALATVENIYYSTDILDDSTAENDFNDILSRFRKAAVLEVLPLILDKHGNYIATQEYDTAINNNLTLFDDCIGYKTAIMVLESFMSTKRSNLTERNSKLSIGALKVELEGITNEKGFLVTSGLVHKFENAIKRAVYKIFPQEIIIQKGMDW